MTIDRIDVRVEVPPGPPERAAAPAPRPRLLSLEDYLAHREHGGDR